jgi:pimeloyl-ACP methyl ester carboxylesterase
VSETALTRVQLRDTRLACIDAGKGEPLICVHGSLGSLYDFSPQVEFFSPSYRVISYSRRFHPPNAIDPSEESYALAVHAADLAELLQTMDAGAATVIASSYGAYVSLVCAIRHPGLIRRLVLGEPPMLPLLRNTHEGQTALEEFEMNALRPSRAAFLEGRPREAVKKFFDGISGRPGAFEMIPSPTQEKLLGAAGALRLEFLTDPSEYMPPLSEEQVRSIGIPVLLLNGERSPRMFSLITDELERFLPDTRRILVPSAGHSIHIANPAYYHEVVGQFLVETESL